MDNPNMDIANIADDLICAFIHKLGKKDGKLTKDELLTYNSALRMLKAIMDSVTEETYPKPEEFNVRGDEDGPAAVPA